MKKFRFSSDEKWLFGVLAFMCIMIAFIPLTFKMSGHYEEKQEIITVDYQGQRHVFVKIYDNKDTLLGKIGEYPLD